ncbi:MAG: class I SAM-dependent methyltransferase [Bacteroidota bacterium]
MNRDKTEIATGVFNKHAHSYQEKFMDVSMYGESFDFFCDQLPDRNAKILELACGPGNITRYLLDKRPDFNILATDLAPNMLALAQTNNPAANFRLMDCRNLEKAGENYNGVMCGFALPYLSKPEVRKLLSDIFRMLKAGGLLYISTMEDDYEKSGFKKGSSGDEIFMHFYTAAFLNDELEKNNFKVLYQEQIESTASDGEKVIDLIMIAGK